MFKNYGMNIASIFRSAEEERLELKHPYVGTEHLLLSILANDEEMSNTLKKYNLTYEIFKKELIMIVGTSSKASEVNLYTPMLKRVINNAEFNAKENNNGIITTKHLILSLLEEGEGIAIRLLVGMGLDIDLLYEELSNDNKIKQQKLEVLETGMLLNDNIDLNEKVIGRDKEIDLIIETLLRKKKNNPILIGDAGVGKTAIVEELVRRIERKEVPESLYNTKIVSLEMGSLVSGTKYRGEFEEKLTKIIKELEKDNKMILFIDEIHSMVTAGGAEGAITAGDIFKPALARGKIKCIGATTNYEYNKFFSNDKALMRRFEIVNISEPNEEETKEILSKVKVEYEKHHNVSISEEMVDKIILYTNKFVINKKNPDKAIDFLDSVCSKLKTDNTYSLERRELYNKLEELKNKKEISVKKNDYEKALNIYNEEIKINKMLRNIDNNKKLEVTEEYIIKVLENKTNMIFSSDKLKKLDNIKESINNKLYGIENEVDKIIDTMKNKLQNKEGFLKVYLEGEENLGKSSLVNIIADSFPKCNFLRIDLNEYKSYSDINKLIGTTQGYIGYSDNHMFSKINNNNFSIILFDNYSKAHDNIKELIKEILKEKYITDNKGEKIYFNNCFIFITNNVLKKEIVGFNNNLDNNETNDLSDLVDCYIKFNKPSKDTLINYLNKMGIIDIDKVLKESNYEIYNYKNINKLIEKEKLLNEITQ